MTLISMGFVRLQILAPPNSFLLFFFLKKEIKIDYMCRLLVTCKRELVLILTSGAFKNFQLTIYLFVVHDSARAMFGLSKNLNYCTFIIPNVC